MAKVESVAPDLSRPVSAPSVTDCVLMQIGVAKVQIQVRVDAIMERDKTIDAAVTGPGMGIGYLLARRLAKALSAAEEEIERLSAQHIKACEALENPTDAMLDAALSATAAHLDIKGSQLTVNREKMRLRLRAFARAALSCSAPPEDK